jgi:hypothetical protein
MATDNIQPVHAINRYIWSKIGDAGEGILTVNDYVSPDGVKLVPIVPVKETPDLYQIIEAKDGLSTLPYIVYTWSRIGRGRTDWWLEEHEIAYSIRSGDQKKMGQLIKIFNHEFREWDRSAMRVNEYIAALDPTPLQQFRFKWINITSLGAEMPADTENGVDEALIVISASFTDGFVA